MEDPFSIISLMFNDAFLFAVIFGVPLAKFIIFLVKAAYQHFITMPDLKARYTSKGKESWAVVTGATDGIGLAFCKELVQMGFNIVIISRSEVKLQSTIKLLNSLKPQKYAESKLKSYAFDFDESSNPEKFQKLKQFLSQLEICLLINNVGRTSATPFIRLPYQTITSLININCVSMCVLISSLVNKMNKRTEKSGIINVSSIAGDRGIPALSLYSGCKSFVNALTDGLNYEYPNMDILNLKPAIVATKMSGFKPRFLIPTADQYAHYSLKQIVYQRVSYGTFSHKVLGYVINNFINDLFFKNLVGVVLGLLWGK